MALKYWEIIADRLKKAGWSLGWVSAVDSNGRTSWIANAHFEAAAVEPVFLTKDDAISYAQTRARFRAGGSGSWIRTGMLNTRLRSTNRMETVTTQPSRLRPYY